MERYPGPVRDGPLAVELHNTVYAVRGVPIDGLADEASAAGWVAAIGDRLPEIAGEATVDLGTLHGLRTAVREALQARVGGQPVAPAALHTLNAASTAAPSALIAAPAGDDHVQLALRFPGSAPDTVLRSVLASSAIELVCGELGDRLRTCGAPGCVLMYFKDHPRREWCSGSCGNRARQARHQARRRRT